MTDLDLRRDASELGDWIANATTLVTEAKIHASADGLRLAAVDPANVGMLAQQLPAADFPEYEAGEVTVGANLERLADVLGMIDGEARVRLDDRQLIVSGDGLRFSVATIDPDSIRSEPELPDLDRPATVTLPASELDRGVSAAALVSDHVTLGVSAELGAFYLEADGDTDDVRHTVEREGMGDPSSIDADAQARFSLDYLQDIARAPGLDGEVTVRVGDEVPVEIECGDELRFVLAPRISSS